MELSRSVCRPPGRARLALAVHGPRANDDGTPAAPAVGGSEHGRSGGSRRSGPGARTHALTPAHPRHHGHAQRVHIAGQVLMGVTMNTKTIKTNDSQSEEHEAFHTEQRSNEDERRAVRRRPA